jgi:predicted RNA-binding Zn ribbon-like protein
VQLILDAANTLDVEDATDAWATPAHLAQWLHGRVGTPASARVSAQDHAAALALRDALRELLLEGNAADFGELAKPFPLRVELVDGLPVLLPVDVGPRAGVARVLAAVATAATDGSWDRVKICPADNCLYAFFDESRNHSRTWCSMRVCGNRTKTRLYRARHQPA